MIIVRSKNIIKIWITIKEEEKRDETLGAVQGRLLNGKCLASDQIHLAFLRCSFTTSHCIKHLGFKVLLAPKWFGKGGILDHSVKCNYFLYLLLEKLRWSDSKWVKCLRIRKIIYMHNGRNKVTLIDMHRFLMWVCVRSSCWIFLVRNAASTGELMRPVGSWHSLVRRVIDWT